MPIYEYHCRKCNRGFQSLVMGAEEAKQVACPHCGSRRLEKLISRVAYHVSEKDRLDAFNPRAPKSDGFYRDSRNIGLQAKKRAEKMGVELGNGFEERLEKLRTDPGSVIKDSE